MCHDCILSIPDSKKMPLSKHKWLSYDSIIIKTDLKEIPMLSSLNSTCILFIFNTVFFSIKVFEIMIYAALINLQNVGSGK
jgi:hypothetical protein